MEDKKALLYQYTFGWKDGAGSRPIDPRRANYAIKEMAAEYMSGYQDGKNASRDMVRAAEHRFGVRLDTLHVMDA